MSPQSSDPFERLIDEARQGNPEAIGRLIEDARGFLMAVANRELESDISPKVGASDLVQNTMMSLGRCIGDFRGHRRDELLAWLRGILVNDVKTARRRFLTAQRDVRRENPISSDDSRHPVRDVAAAEMTPGTDAMAREEAELLAAAMRRLATLDREVIELRNWQRLSFTEIGERTGRTGEAARKLWSRAIMRLQSEMDRGRD